MPYAEPFLAPAQSNLRTQPLETRVSRRYAVLCCLADGTTAQIIESDDLEAAKAATEELARKKQSYFFVLDRVNKSVVYVYCLRDGENQTPPSFC